MQDKIDCKKINEIREERMQTQFYTGSAKSMPTSSTQATHLRFSFLFLNSFITSEPHRDNPSLVFRNSCNLRDPRSLNQSLCTRRKKRNSLLKRRILQLKSMDELLMDLQVFAQEFLLRDHLAMKFSWNLSHCFLKSDTHIYIGPSCLFKMV